MMTSSNIYWTSVRSGAHQESYPPPESPELKKYIDARTRLANRIQRNLDGMQITLANDNTIANQIFAIVISVVIAYLIIKTEQPESPIPFQLTFLLGVAAG